MSQLKAILFDFGGCLDSDGMHSRTLFLQVFNRFGIMKDISKESFQEAYSYADKKMIAEKLVIEANLRESNLIMVELILCALEYHDQNEAKPLADEISKIQESFFSKNAPTLEKLSKNFRLGIISNFTGNLELILKEYKLHHYFEHILDSYHVGFSKPDIKIFEEALNRFKIAPENCLFVGDNIERDILPAKSLGMKTVLIHEPIHSRTFNPGPDAYILEIAELLEYTKININSNQAT